AAGYNRFLNIDDGVAWTVLSQRKHGLARLSHLPNLHMAGRDDARSGSMQHRLGEIVARRRQLRLRGIQHGERASMLLFGLVVVAPGGEAVLKQRLLTLENRCHLAQFRFRSLNASACALNVSFLDFRVQPRQNFPWYDVLANFHLTFDNPTANAEGKLALHARGDFSRERGSRSVLDELDWLDLDGQQ